MLHSTYLETSRLESSMHPNFTKAMQGRCQGIYQRIWLYLTKYLYFATTWNWQWSRDSHYSSCLWSDALHSGTWNPYMVHVQKNTQDLQLPNLLLQPYSYPSCLKMPDMSWASIRTGNTPKRCWMSQDEKTARGHFDSTEKKNKTHPSSLVFYDVWRPLQAIAPLTPVLTPVSLRFSRRTQLLRNHQHHHCIASAFCRCSPISSACWPVSNRLLGLIMVFPFFLPKVWDTVCTTNLQHLYNRVSLSAWLLLFPLTSKAQWTRVKVVSKRSGTRLTYKICTPSHSGWQQKWGPSQFSVSCLSKVSRLNAFGPAPFATTWRSLQAPINTGQGENGDLVGLNEFDMRKFDF